MSASQLAEIPAVTPVLPTDGVQISTWADGFGNWHASVRIARSGSRRLAHEYAQQAIGEQITAREAAGYAIPDRFGVEMTAYPRGTDRTDGRWGFVESWADAS